MHQRSATSALGIRNALWALSDTVPDFPSDLVAAHAGASVLQRLGFRAQLVPVGYVFFNETGLRSAARLSVFESGSIILPFGLNPPDHLAVRCGDWLFDAGLACSQLLTAQVAASPLIARFDDSFWSGDDAVMCSREGGGGALVLIGSELPSFDVDPSQVEAAADLWLSALQATHPELEALS